MSSNFLSNVRRCAAIAAIVAAPVPVAAAAIKDELPPHTLMMFVAAWCAPCRGELARLKLIEAGARPARVRVVPIDADRRTEAMLRGVPADRIWRPTPAERATLAVLLRDTAGLPYSVMTDAKGRTCAASKRGLDGVQAAAMVARCEGGAARP